jgi:hypothetical protein
MSGRRNGDAGRKIQIHVPVDIFDDGTFATRHDKRRAPGIRRRDDRGIALDNRARARSRRGHFDIWNSHFFWKAFLLISWPPVSY